MMRKEILILTISLIGIITNVHAQHEPAIRNTIQPMAGTANVGEGTGVLNYSIPLFTLESN